MSLLSGDSRWESNQKACAAVRWSKLSITFWAVKSSRLNSKRNTRSGQIQETLMANFGARSSTVRAADS